jgi:hypothetical protein
MESPFVKLLSEQLKLVAAARVAFAQSSDRAEEVLRRVQVGGLEATVPEKETLEALTSRFARLADILFQRVFRTLDQIELIDEGTNIDRLNRMEKRGLISSAESWRQIRQLRNSIAHEYLIEASDSVVVESIQQGKELLATTDRIINYSKNKGYLA